MTDDPAGLSGKVALVTGGASGIGAGFQDPHSFPTYELHLPADGVTIRYVAPYKGQKIIS